MSSRSIPKEAIARTPDGAVERLAAGALDDAETFALADAATPLLRDLIGRGFAGLRMQAKPDELLHYVHLPLLLHAALTGDPSPARPLVTVTTLVYLGADIFDDVLDGDERPQWNGVPAHQIALAAMTLWTVLPQLALSRIPAARESAQAMRDTLTRGVLTMIEGQLADVAGAGAPSPSPEAVHASADAKSGGELALFTRLTAELPGLDRETIDGCTEMGRAMGLAAQTASDCADVFHSDHSHDLSNGTRTLPVALHLSGLASDAHPRFLQRLDEARHERAAQLAVRNEMLEAGCLRQCALVVAIQVQKALRHLSAVARFDEPTGVLREWIQGIAFGSRSSPASRNRQRG